MKSTYARKNSKFKASLDMINDYIFDERGNVKDKDFWFTIFPLPDMGDCALSKKV
jgi:hypothetical protein